MDIIEIDKFLPKKTCDYCIKFFEDNKKHWQSFNKRDKIHVQNILNFNLTINRLYLKYTKLYPNHKLINLEILRWPSGEHHVWHDDTLFYDKTTITYLNENYEGGKTTVEDYTVEPKTGKIILFDADKKHKVSMVTKGPRYVILAWYNKN
tara:strand:+ start:242 stop:691 length:450 start_codon:yes stop_codon:yes gene_type:complete